MGDVNYAARLVRGMIGLLHDWKRAGENLSKVDYFPGVKKAEAPRIARLSASELDDAMLSFIANETNLGTSSGDEIARFLDDFLPHLGLTWNHPERARLRSMPNLRQLAQELLSLLVVWHTSRRRLPRTSRPDVNRLRASLNALDARRRAEVYGLFLDLATDREVGWSIGECERFLEWWKRRC
jgi:hypothetical protein